MPVALWLSLSRHKFKWWWFGCEWCIRRQILSMLRFLWKESFLMLWVWSVCILIPCHVYILKGNIPMWVLALWLCRKDSTAFSSQTRTASDAFSDSNPCKIIDSKMETIDAGRAICRKFCLFCTPHLGVPKHQKPASRDIFGRARAPEFGSFLWHHFVHQFWGFNFFPFLFPLKWYNWKTSILRSSRSQTIKAETPVELDSAILKLYKGGLCSGTRICKTKPNQSARWLSQARPWAESEQSLPLLVAPCKATARCAARSYEHLHWGQRETDPRITMLTSFNISFQNTDSFSLPPPPFRCHPWKLVLARVHVRMKDFHPKTPRRFTLYHPWPLADSKQIEGLPPKMMCFTSHSLQSEGILNHLRRPYRYKHTSMMAMLCYQTPKMSCQ